MTYFNNYNLYPASTAVNEFDPYPFLGCGTLATSEEDSQQGTQTFAGDWATVDQPESLAIPSTSFLAMGYESAFPTFDSYLNPLHESHQPVTTEVAQPDYPIALSWEGSFVGSQQRESPMPALTHDPIPADFWGSHQYDTPVVAPYADDLPNHYQPGHGAYHSQTNTYENAEAGSSTHVPPPLPHSVPLTPQPTGGISETTADAEEKNQFTEQDESSAPRTRRAPGEGVPRPHRERNQENVVKLRTWAKALRGCQKLPSHKNAIAAAADFISARRQPVYDEDRLFQWRSRRIGVQSRRYAKEHERRDETRRVYRRLSRYYLLEGGCATWTMTQLLFKVLEDLDDVDDDLRNTSPHLDGDHSQG